MSQKVVQIRVTMFKYRIKSYQVSKALGIPDSKLSKMFNGHIPMSNKIYRGIMDYLGQFENSRQPACEVTK